MVRRTARALLLASSLMLFPLLGHAAEPLVTAAGMGANYLSYVNSQKSTKQGVDLENRFQFVSTGVFVFADLIRYFTVYLGYRIPIGSVQIVSTAGGNQSNSVFDYAGAFLDVGAEAKYPFRLTSWFTVAPKVGLEKITYLTGNVGGRDPGDDGRIITSPWLLSLGADLDFRVTPEFFLRFPIDVGIGLNSRLSESNYTDKTNVSTSVVSGKVGCVVGYAY